MTSPSEEYRLIPLSQGQFAKVSPEDFEWLNQWKWNAYWHARTRSYYAVRNQRHPDGTRSTVKMHRVILQLERGDKRIGDHANLDTLDNRRSNLRIATISQNASNTLRRSNSTGFKGVSFNKFHGLYMAKIRKNNKQIHLGYRNTPEEAHKLYCEASARLHGEFGRTS